MNSCCTVGFVLQIEWSFAMQTLGKGYIHRHGVQVTKLRTQRIALLSGSIGIQSHPEYVPQVSYSPNHDQHHLFHALLRDASCLIGGGMNSGAAPSSSDVKIKSSVKLKFCWSFSLIYCASYHQTGWEVLFWSQSYFELWLGHSVANNPSMHVLATPRSSSFEMPIVPFVTSLHARNRGKARSPSTCVGIGPLDFRLGNCTNPSGNDGWFNVHTERKWLLHGLFGGVEKCYFRLTSDKFASNTIELSHWQSSIWRYFSAFGRYLHHFYIRSRDYYVLCCYFGEGSTSQIRSPQ